MKWGIFVYTTSKTEERTRWIRDTWGKNVENLFFFTDKSYPEDNFIKVTDDTDYESNMVKNLDALKYAYENDFDWIFLVGDDVYIFINNLLAYIEPRDPNTSEGVCGEIIHGTWPVDRSLSYLCGGGGILFSKHSLKKFMGVMKDPASYRDYIYADVVIGLLMKEAQLKMVNLELLIKGNPPEYYNIKKPEQYISFHFIKTEKQFKELWSKDKPLSKYNQYLWKGVANL